MDANLGEAPPKLEISEKEQMKINIKKESQKILEKYFESRDYNKEKIKLWKDYAIEEVSKYLVEKYNNYGFVISFIITKFGTIRDDEKSIYRIKTDDNIYILIQTNKMFCLMRIFFYRIYDSKINLIKEIEDNNIYLKMNEILTNKLEGKKYSYEFALNSCIEITNELNDYLLKKKKTRYCSLNQCSILQKPIDFVFNYKVINLHYIPLMIIYSNDSLYSQLLLIILNN